MNTIYLPTGFKFYEDTIDVTKAAVFIPEVWAQRVLATIYAKNPTIGCVLHDYSEEVAQEGDIVHIQKRGALASHNKTAGTAVTLNNPTGATIPVTLSNHKEVSFLVEDVAEAQSNTSLIDGYTQDADCTPSVVPVYMLGFPTSTTFC